MTAHAAAARRTRSTVALAVACALTTTGCIYDAAPPRWAKLVNERTSSVTLTYDGPAAESQEIAAREGRSIRYEGELIAEEEGRCVDVGATVTDTATGQVLGTVDPPICGGTRIYVREDGTVDVR